MISFVKRVLKCAEYTSIISNSDITCSMMTSKKLGKLKRELVELQKSPQGRKSRDFSRLATKLGRKLVGGTEPNYVRTEPFKSFPLSIPNHSGDMPTGTAASIIESLLDDVDVRHSTPSSMELAIQHGATNP